ncbi:D-2-hydroxyacid dehydrogenase [Companilactobacillus baiquanensis]|uniref:D-2-hydroxyacid dehydrogenase n=1 Tax=Companilactobacillus baiquanensis TaxID=2486005 RepID=A0ABW1UWS3_9LACO|nr:D-2-hydroxyacid dehydrogenase [Companilactobacillus baiquanensis]
MKIYVFGLREDEIEPLNQWKAANTDVDVDYTTEILTEETANLAKGADGVVAVQTQPYTRKALEIIHDLGISKFSVRNVGLDGFNFKDLNDFGFTLTYVPVYSPNAIAEHASFLVGRLLRRVPEFDKKFQSGNFKWFPTIGTEISGKTVGVIGTGHIGSVFARIMQFGYGANVIAYDIDPNPALENLGIYVDTLDELLEKSDIISIHTPLAPKDHHMLDADAINKMKNGVYLINCARGGLLDNQALIDGLNSGKIAGAGLDVLENENGIFQNEFNSVEDVDDEVFQNLAHRDNVIITPHTAFYTERAVHNMIFDSMNDNKLMISGKEPKNAVDTHK